MVSALLSFAALGEQRHARSHRVNFNQRLGYRLCRVAKVYPRHDRENRSRHQGNGQSLPLGRSHGSLRLQAGQTILMVRRSRRCGGVSDSSRRTSTHNRNCRRHAPIPT